MKIVKTNFNGLKVFQGKKFTDKRGYFREVFKKKFLNKKRFVFWCMSSSKKNVLRGMHLQKINSQEKFISVIKGSILDVVIDLRKNSRTCGKVFKIILSDKNCKSLFIPSGFAHGFCGLETENIIFYGNTNYRSKKSEICISWKDKRIKSFWPKKKYIISKKDNSGISFNNFFKKK